MRGVEWGAANPPLPIKAFLARYGHLASPGISLPWNPWRLSICLGAQLLSFRTGCAANRKANSLLLVIKKEHPKESQRQADHLCCHPRSLRLGLI